MATSAHPHQANDRASNPVFAVVPFNVTYMDFTAANPGGDASIDDTGQTVVSSATAANLIHGVVLMNHSTVDAFVSNASDGTFMILPKKANDLVTAVPIPGQGAVYVKSSSGVTNVDITGYYI